MSAHADAWFSIGASHRVCQDYARAEGAAAFLSDGCSSSPDTDVGARLWALAAAREAEAIPVGETARERARAWLGRVVYRVSVTAGSTQGMRLDRRALDATLGWVFPLHSPDDPSPPWVAGLAGDGAICARRRDGRLETTLVQFLPGEDGRVAPAYPSYDLDARRRQSYLGGGYGRVAETAFVDGEPLFREGRQLDGHEDIRWTYSPLYLFADSFPASTYDVVAVFSDGVESFQREVSPKKWEPVSVHEVLVQLMAIKSSTGAFVERRCRAFEERFCVAERWRHLDDFSMAAVWTGDAPAEAR